MPFSGNNHHYLSSLPIQAAAIGAAADSAEVRDPRGPVTRRTLRKLKRKHAARGRGQAADRTPLRGDLMALYGFGGRGRKRLGRPRESN